MQTTILRISPVEELGTSSNIYSMLEKIVVAAEGAF